MRPTRTLAFALMGSVACLGATQAQDYPTRNLRIVLG